MKRISILSILIVNWAFVAAIYCGLGEKDKAFAELQKLTMRDLAIRSKRLPGSKRIFRREAVTW